MIPVTSSPVEGYSGKAIKSSGFPGVEMNEHLVYRVFVSITQVWRGQSQPLHVVGKILFGILPPYGIVKHLTGVYWPRRGSQNEQEKWPWSLVGQA